MRGSAMSLTYCPRPSVSRFKFGRGTERPIYEFGRSSSVSMGGESSAIFISQKPCRPEDRAPHVGGRRVVEAEAFLWLLEVAADDVDKVVEIDLGVRVERIDVVHADEPRGHVPLVLPRALVFLDDVR